MRLKSLFKRKPKPVAVRNAFQHDKKKLKHYEYDLLLMWKGTTLKGLKMHVQAPDRTTAKHEVMSVLQFKLSNIKEVEPDSKKK